MTGAGVLGAYGDPGVGLTAARTGLSWCVTALRAGALTPDDAMRTAMVRALSVERDLLVGLGHGDETDNAESTLLWLDAEAVPTLVAERIAGDSPGLLLAVADAVAATGDPVLAALLCGEPVGPVCAPVLRVAPQLLTGAGLAAAEAALRLLPGDATVRLGLEAHYLLAFAYEEQLPEFTPRHDKTCLLWCRLFAALCAQCGADGDTRLASDLAAWGARVVCSSASATPIGTWTPSPAWCTPSTGTPAAERMGHGAHSRVQTSLPVHGEGTLWKRRYRAFTAPPRMNWPW